MALVYREAKCFCGDFLEVELYPVFEQKGGARGKLRKPSKPVQEMLNRKNARKKFRRILQLNFTEADDKLTLGFDDGHEPESIDEARRFFQNFIRRVKRYRRRKGLSDDFKYMAVLEQGKRKGRFHFHMVASGGLDHREWSNLWGAGHPQVKPLEYEKTGFKRLVDYYAKKPLTKRFQSRNLVMPEIKCRDGRFSGRKVSKMVASGFCPMASEIEKLYPDFALAEGETIYNDVNGGFYVSMMFYRRDVFGKRNHPLRQPTAATSSASGRGFLRI